MTEVEDISIIGVYSFWKNMTEKFEGFNIVGDIFEIIYEEAQKDLRNYSLFELKDEVFKLGHLQDNYKVYGDLPDNKEELIAHIQKHELDIKPIKKGEKKEMKIFMEYEYIRGGEFCLTIQSQYMNRRDINGHEYDSPYVFMTILEGEIFVDKNTDVIYKFVNTNQYKNSGPEYDPENNTNELTFQVIKKVEDLLFLTEDGIFDVSYEEEDFFEHEEDKYEYEDIYYNDLVYLLDKEETVRIQSYYDMYNTYF